MTEELFQNLNTLDFIVFGLVILATLAAVIYGHHRKGQLNEEKSFLDFLVMGRQLTLPLFVATLVATWYGGIFGVTQIAFESGLYNFLTQGVFWYLTYIFFALFMIKKVRSYQAVTLPELIGKLFGPKAAFLGGIFNIMNVIPVSYTISLGLLLKTLFGIDFTWSMIIALSFVTLYSLFGGFRAVVFSDLVQFLVMCLGVFLVVVFSASTFGGFSFLQAKLPATHFSFTGGNSLATTMVWGFIAVSTLIDPNFYQRCFAALDDKTARNGILLSTVVWIGFDLCTTFGAMYARAVLPEAEPSTAYLQYCLQVLPHGLRGFVLAGIVATILSTIDSYLFIAGSTLSYDLLPGNKKNVFRAHAGVFLTAILSLILATSFEGNIKLVWKTLGSYSAACLLFPVLWGYLFPKRISDTQFVVICLFGVVTTTYWRLAEHSGFWKNVDELYIGVATTGLGLILSTLIHRGESSLK